MNIIKRIKPLYLFLIFYTISFVCLYLKIVKGNGSFMYSADDPFIHMTIVNNIIKNGYFGVSGGEFSTASSSVLWTLLLYVIFRIVGENIMVPLILNFLFGILLLVMIDKLTDKMKFKTLSKISLMFFVLSYPRMLQLSFVGMEHLLSAFLAVLFLYIFYKYLCENFSFVILCVISTLLVASRYETAFIVLPCVMILFFKKEYAKSFILGISSMVLIVIFGLYYMKHGNHFLPNSLLLKGNKFEIDGLFDFIKMIGHYFLYFASLSWTAMLLYLFTFMPIFKIEKEERKRINLAFFIFFIHGFLFHLFLADKSGYYRYLLFYRILKAGMDVYLLQAITLNVIEKYKLSKNVIKNGTFIMIWLIFIYSIFGFLADYNTAKFVSKEIYTQQYQMSKFVKKYYKGEKIAANDIGLISYYSKVELLDLWGLGSTQVAEARNDGYYDTKFISDIVKKKKIKIVIVYDNWFDDYGGLPKQWHKFAEWNYKNTLVVGRKVSFYVIDESDKKEALKNMKEFEKVIPKEVKIKLYK